MSTRTKFENFLNVQGAAKRTPKPSNEGLGDSLKKKNIKKIRKLRQTNELFCFSSVEDDDISKTSPPFARRTNFSRSPITTIDLTTPEFQKNISDEGQNKLLIKKESTFIREEPMFFDENKENSLHIQKTLSPAINKDLEKRRIVKARRTLKSKVCNVEVDKLTQESKDELRILQNIDGNIEENSNILIVEPLANPISPSANSSEDKANSPSHFDCSKEELYPSTSGKTGRRRTFELEDSVTDISLLKSLSKRDSTRLSSISTTENTSHNLTGRKVTQRRRWDKSNNFSPIIFVKESEPKMQTPIISKLSTPTSAKKVRSKVKIPNFAAIHKKALDKVECISDYKKRKDERARRLLSGLKPKADRQDSSTKESRKQLKFAPGAEERARKLGSEIKAKSGHDSSTKNGRKHLRFAPNTSPKEKSPTFIPLPCTPLPRRRPTVESPTPVKTSPFKFTEFKPVFNFTKKVNGTPSVRQNNSKAKIPSPKNEKKPFSKGFNFHFGFAKPPSTNVFQPKNNMKINQQNQIKSIATKSKPTANAVETRRCNIKGVRSNRRFELLMNMRKGK